MFNSKTQTRFWLIFLAVFAIIIWALKPMLLPFVAGMVIAYFLDPVVELMSHRKLPRWLSSVLVLVAFGMGIVLLFALIVPLLREQLGALMNALPGYIEKARNSYVPWLENWLARFSPDTITQIKTSASQYAGEAAGVAGGTVKSIITSGMHALDALALVVITPIVAFYFLRDWPQLTQAVDRHIPRKYYKVIRREIEEINRTLSGFIRGQALVCLALGVFYALGLALTGLQYSLSIGLMAGALSFIPYVGTIFAWIVSLILAFGQFDSFTPIIGVLVVLCLGQILEGYVLAPRLIGERVGLHPMWILFALLAGASLMGFLGMLIAVPVAAILGVLVRFGLRQYRASSLYKEQI